ncbi:MAG: PilZ domain-containing protein [Myxococcota bacterium]
MLCTGSASTSEERVWSVSFSDGLALLASHFQEGEAEGILLDTVEDVPVGAPVTLRVNLGRAVTEPLQLACTVRWRRVLHTTPPRVQLALDCARESRPLLRRLLTVARDVAGAAANRAHTRVPTRMGSEVRSSDGLMATGVVLDLSEDGALINMPAVHAAGTVVQLTLKPGPPQPNLVIRALVIWHASRGERLTGLMFLHDDEEQRKALRHIVAVIMMRQGVAAR